MADTKHPAAHARVLAGKGANLFHVSCDKCRNFDGMIRRHHAQPENEWCDQLAKEAAAVAGLPADPGYKEK